MRYRCGVQSLFLLRNVRSYILSSHLLKGLDPNWGSKQHLEKRKVKLGFQYQALRENLNYAEIEKYLEPIRASVKEQGDIVRHLKACNALENDITREVQLLKIKKKELEDMIQKFTPTNTFDRARMMDLIKRRFYYDVSFSIYGGIAGHFDYGPMGCEVVDNILAEWTRHFVIRDRMLKVSCSSLTPESVLKASGHVDKFVDYIVKDEKTGEYFRLDHVLKQHFENILSSSKLSEKEKEEASRLVTLLDGMSLEEMNKLVKKFNVKSPVTGNVFTDPCALNLMFPVTIGPSGSTKGFLRPETAQGIFVNFKKLLEYKQQKLPFACAQIGIAYRNEIAPKSGLLRVREFLMAEIEHFCDPDEKSHPKFSQVSNTELWLYSACDQMDGELPKLLSVGEAVQSGFVANETLGYYLSRIHHFLVRIGINPQKLRFRQHLSNEMAHYASDCWDAEILTSYGWTECVGCADRSAYDLQQHSIASGVSLSVDRPLLPPRTEKMLCPVLDLKNLKKSFGHDAQTVKNILEQMKQEDVQNMDDVIRTKGSFTLKGGYEVTRNEITGVTLTSKLIQTERIIPNVVEPSFGIGRIFYALLEHSFRVREDDSRRTYFSLNAIVAPVKASLLPLINKTEFNSVAYQLSDSLTEMNISSWIDDTRGTIGRRYVRMDEMGVPFCVTVDEGSIEDTNPSVTLRERDSTAQVRIPVHQVADVINRLSGGKITWEDVVEEWPKVGAREP